MSGADKLLSRLDGVKRTGPGKWAAKCPGHADRRASLAIKETDDGRVLAHCFAGCSISEVVGTIGLELSDLFPAKAISGDFKQGERRPWTAADVLRAVGFESLVVAVAAGNLAQGVELSPEDRQRLMLAAERLQGAAGAIEYA